VAAAHTQSFATLAGTLHLNSFSTELLYPLRLEVDVRDMLFGTAFRRTFPREDGFISLAG